MGLWLAKVDNEHDYDYQNAGYGSSLAIFPALFV
jgi:hypothetical protein